VPCRKQNPQWAAIYKKFADKGFNILQFSMDVKKDVEKWKAAIRKDGLSWHQISDLLGFASPVVQAYGVQPIPDNFLIDPNGKILARGLEPDAIEKKLTELLSK
jgi:alkyl hydroperoxide reductase subunit AhpC